MEGDHNLATPEHRLERLVFFSDAVFAIAITLLVIEIRVPHIAVNSDAAYLNALGAMIPQFIGFVVSFAVIGSFWGGHHRAFACAAHWDPRLTSANLQLLGFIAAGPFFTAFSSDYGGARVPVALYATWLLATALVYIRLQRIVTSPPVVSDGIAPEYLATNRRRAWAVAAGGAIAVVIALIIPILALPSLISIPIIRLIADRRAARLR